MAAHPEPGQPEDHGLPVVRDWFRIRPAGGALTVIDEPYVHELLQANIWLVRGRDRDLLVDSGLGIASLRGALAGLALRDPVLVLTHAHLDHMGSAHEFPGCWAHPAEPAGNPPRGSLNGPALAAELGLDEPLPQLLISAVPHPGYDPAGYRLQGARVTRNLGDRDAVDLGDRAFTVLHLPGHSPGSIALFDEHDGTLFSGDVLYDDVLLDTIAGADPGEYGASLRRLRGMPVRTVRPGHGPSFGLRLMRTIIDRHLASRVTAGGTSQERPGPARAHQVVARLRAGGRGRAEPGGRYGVSGCRWGKDVRFGARE